MPTRPHAVWGQGELKDSALSADGSTLVIASSFGVLILDAVTLETRRVIRCGRQLRAVGISEDGRWVTAYAGRHFLERLPEAVLVWHAESGTPGDRELPRPQRRRSWDVRSPGGRWRATAEERGDIHVVGAVDRTIPIGGKLTTMGFNREDGLVVARLGDVAVVDPASGEVRQRRPWPRTAVQTLSVDGEGIVTAEIELGIGSATERVTLRLRDGVEIGRTASWAPWSLPQRYPELFEEDGPLSPPRAKGTIDASRGALSDPGWSVTRRAVEGGGRIAGIVDPTTIVVLDAATGALVNRLTTVAPARKLALDDTGTLLAAALNRKAVLQTWDTNTGEQLAHGTVHSYGLSDLIFTPGGEHLVTCGEQDRMISFWTPRPMSLATEYVGHAKPLQALAADPSGAFLVSGGYDGSVCWWPLPERRPST